MGDRLRALALTRRTHVPSARFRVGQYVEPLAGLGVDLDWRPAPVSAYPPVRRWLRPFWLPLSVAGRLPGLAASYGTGVTLLNREFVSTLATLEGLVKRPRVFDVDDAIFLRRGGRSAAWIARRMDVIVAGNDFLAEWFGRHNDDVVVLPTAVDTDRFRPGERPDRDEWVIGWSGTSGNLVSLDPVLPGLAAAMKKDARLVFAVSSDRRPDLPGLDPDRVRFVPWSPGGEVDFIRSLDVGLMPLPDTDWSRGKCAYKMLLYLACGVPAVTSPVGMNARLLEVAEVGLAARGADEWTDAFLALASDPDGGRAMGENGRRLVEREYSLKVLAPRLADVLKGAAAGRGAA